MPDSILQLDREILLAVNGWNSPAADMIMMFFSSITVWIPLYVVMAGLMFVPGWYGRRSAANTAYGSGSKFWVIGLISLAAAGICFGLTDQITHIMKESIQRFRPSHEPLLEPFVRLIDGAGGLYGFPSGHAASSMGFAVITSLIFRKRWYSILIICWSLVVGYSRMYLARHYLSDVLCGILIGIIIAVSVYYLWKYVLLYRHHHRPVL